MYKLKSDTKNKPNSMTVLSLENQKSAWKAVNSSCTCHHANGS